MSSNTSGARSAVPASPTFDLRTVLALTTTLVLWASAFPAIRVALRFYSPGHIALLRFLVASAVFGLYVMLWRRPLPARRDWPGIALMGLLGFTIYNLGLNYGEQSVTAGAASFLINTAPVFTVVLAVLFLGERLKPVGWLGVVVSFAGASIIALGEGGGFRFSPAALYILAAAASASCYLILQKGYLKRYNAFDLTGFVIWGGTAFLLFFAPGLGQAMLRAPASATWSIIYMGIFPAAIAYSLWAYVLSHWPASRTVSFLYLVPALTLMISWLWLGEVPALISVVGGFVALAGVLLVNLWGK